jgi:hypothetical protein
MIGRTKRLVEVTAEIRKKKNGDARVRTLHLLTAHLGAGQGPEKIKKRLEQISVITQRIEEIQNKVAFLYLFIIIIIFFYRSPSSRTKTFTFYFLSFSSSF